MRPENVEWYGWTCAFIGFMGGCVVMMLIVGLCHDNYQAEAVKRGYAEWVVDQQTGTTTWRWKESK